MIGDGLFQAQLNTAARILDDLDLLEERQRFPNRQLRASHFRGMTYREIYEDCVREYAYDFRLSDQSLLVFSKAGNDLHDGVLSYSYLECPVVVMVYREFVGREIGISVMDRDSDERIDDWGDELRADYEQYVNSLVTKNSVTPIRYDYKAADYRPGIHPASHVHFGQSNEIRVGTYRVMKPLSFVLFLLRQRYPREWEQFRLSGDMATHARNVRHDLDIVHATYWDVHDEYELILH